MVCVCWLVVCSAPDVGNSVVDEVILMYFVLLL